MDVLLPLLLSACGLSPSEPGPLRLGEPEALSPADAVAAADLDGDGEDSLVLVSGGVARWDGREQALEGELQAVARGDLDGDGREELLLGTGMGRSHRDASARVWLLDEQGARSVWERSGARNQITELRVGTQGAWMAVFGEDKRVEGGWLRPADATGWSFEPELEEPMATRQLPLDGGVVFGRVYGDEPRSDGDLSFRGPGGVVRLPSLRGVRSLLAVQLDDGPEPELLVGDGWHYRYGSEAVARVRLLQGEGFQRARTIASFDQEYTVRQLEASSQGPEAWLLATGSRMAHVLWRDGLGWQDSSAGEPGESGNAVIATRRGQQGVLISGEPARFVPVLR
jgi:hypothetical protein